MNKSLMAVVGVILLFIVGWYLAANNQKDPETELEPEVETGASSPLDATYLVDGESFTLQNGSAEKDIVPETGTKNNLSVFGSPMFGDIDGDGDQDAVLILVNNPGGSGTFYYTAMAVNTDGRYYGTDTILLGDRIAPQTFYIEGDRAIVNYVERNPDESVDIPPSVGKSLYLQFDPVTLQLILIAPNFEGEADPNIMTLDMQPWTWIKTIYNNDTEVTPKVSKAFTMAFKEDGTFSATTDCNSMGGTYKATGENIKFGSIAMTRMYCEDSEEQIFATLLEEVQSFFFTSKGELIFDLKLDSGSAIFR